MPKLLFTDGVDASARARISYSFATWCAVYGYAEDDGVILTYGADIPAAYVPRDLGTAIAAPRLITRTVRGREISVPVFYQHGDAVDWLGECFEWLSGQEERFTAARDAIGRVPYAATLNGRFDLDPLTPWAAVMLAAFNESVRASVGAHWREHPSPPFSRGERFVVQASHDVDYLPTRPWLDCWRLAKNMVDAGRSGGLAAAVAIAGQALRSWWRRGCLVDGLARLVDDEQQRGITADYNLIVRRAHRRDADYRIADAGIRRQLAGIRSAGSCVGVHGSYESLGRRGRLAAEYARVRQHYPARGGRQHWLRWHGDVLFDELVQAGSQWDGTIGFPERPGFRWGACFPFLPYDFAREAPYPLLELPLMLMDTALVAAAPTGNARSELTTAIMEQARHWGWGGCGVLWHDTVTGGYQLPADVPHLYWQGLDQADGAWSGDRIHAAVWPRYRASFARWLAQGEDAA